MRPGMPLVVYPVKDLAKAKTLFREALGVEPYVDQAYYVGFRVGDQEIGLDPHGHSKGQTGPIGYLDVDDINARLRALLAAGGRERQGVKDVGGGLQNPGVGVGAGTLLGLRRAPR